MLTWQNRITRIRERCRDLWGREGWRWRVIRTSQRLRVPRPAGRGLPAFLLSPTIATGTPDQEVSKPLPAPAVDPNSPLERALARFAAAVAAKDGIEQGAGG